MAECSGALHLPVEGNALLRKVIQCGTQNLAIILIHNPASVHSDNIIEAPPLVHAERHRSILHEITEGKLHLIAVFGLPGTFLDAFERKILSEYRSEELTNLLTLDLQLLLIGDRLVSAASADSVMGTGTLRLQRGWRNHTLQAAFHAIAAIFRHHRLNYLARNGILHHHTGIFHCQNAFIRERQAFHHSRNYCSFLHIKGSFLSKNLRTKNIK